MNSLARCDFRAKSSDGLELLDCVRIETRQNRSAPAAFIRVPKFPTKLNYRQMFSRAAVRKPIAEGGKDKGAGCQACALTERGTRVDVPRLELIIRRPIANRSGTAARRSWRR